MLFNFYIPVTVKDLDLVLHHKSLFFNNLPCKKIFFIGNNEVNKHISISSKVDFLHEDKVFTNLTLKNIRELIIAQKGNGNRSGWYLQQFIKMAISYLTNEPYVVWDADTLPMRRIDLISLNGKFYLTTKEEFHMPYFTTLARLTNNLLDKIYSFSFISEHMVIIPEIMRELIGLIQINSISNFPDLIIKNINKEDLNYSGFSEFETYGTFALKYHSNHYETRKLNTLREGAQFFGKKLNKNQIKWLSKDFDIVSFEKFDKPSLFFFFFKIPLIKFFFRFSQLIKIKNW
jgi:hypothetical protein